VDRLYELYLSAYYFTNIPTAKSIEEMVAISLGVHDGRKVDHPRGQSAILKLVRSLLDVPPPKCEVCGHVRSEW
jgi:hypothetical protein